MTLVGLAAVLLVAGQAPASPTIDVDAARDLLANGRITRVTTLSKGVTRPRRVTLTDGIRTHDAVFQSIDEERPVERFSSGRLELGFRDSWHFNIAAFELARLVGLDAMVPPCVERVVRGQRGSLCWWVPWKWDEQMRIAAKLRPPDPVRWQRQWDQVRVFRELIDDTDRNQTNMLISEDWHLWMVDFSRAFRQRRALRAPQHLQRCPRALLERLQALDQSAVRAAVGGHLRPAEIEGVIARRQLLIEHFARLAAERGADQVFF